MNITFVRPVLSLFRTFLVSVLIVTIFDFLSLSSYFLGDSLFLCFFFFFVFFNIYLSALSALPGVGRGSGGTLAPQPAHLITPLSRSSVERRALGRKAPSSSSGF